MHKCSDSNGVADTQLLCLNGWPQMTIGWHEEHALISELNKLCKSFGYGRVPQLAAAIEDIWRHPEKVAKYEKDRVARLEFMEQAVDNQ